MACSQMKGENAECPLTDQAMRNHGSSNMGQRRPSVPGDKSEPGMDSTMSACNECFTKGTSVPRTHWATFQAKNRHGKLGEDGTVVAEGGGLAETGLR